MGVAEHLEKFVQSRGAAEGVEKRLNRAQVMGIWVAEYDHVVRIERYAGRGMPGGKSPKDTIVDGPLEEGVQDIDHEREEHW